VAVDAQKNRGKNSISVLAVAAGGVVLVVTKAKSVFADAVILKDRKYK